jgi:hypothetical protein
MNHRQVILCLTKVASPNRSKAFDPSDGSFDDPTAGRIGFSPGRDFFLTEAANVGNIGVLFRLSLDPGVVVPLVQAQVLRRIGRRVGPREDSRCQGRGDQPAIMNVGTGQGDPQRYALLSDMQMGLASTPSPIRRVAPQGLVFEADGLTPHGSKHLTFPIEQDNSNIRHFLARFRRRTKVVSKTEEMVDLSLRLYHHLHDQPAAFTALSATFLYIFC